MVFCGSTNVERIIVHPMDNLNESHYIDIVTDKDDPVFYVTCCCDEDWGYEFPYNKSDYERIKFNIMEAIFECDTMDELLDVLSEIFEDGFETIEDECDGDCANCECYEF